MDAVHQQTSAYFFYSCHIVPLAQVMDGENKVLLLNAYFYNRTELTEHLPAIEEVVDLGDKEMLKSILWYCQPQTES